MSESGLRTTDEARRRFALHREVGEDESEGGLMEPVLASFQRVRLGKSRRRVAPSSISWRLQSPVLLILPFFSFLSCSTLLEYG